MAANYEAVARAHMAQQVREAATVQAALTRLWEQTLDPRDVAGSFIRFRKSAAVYVGAGRTISDRTALRYVESVARLSGVSAPGMAAAVMDPDHIELSLTGASAKSLGRASRLQRAGLDPSVALRVAMGNSLGAAKRHVLNAGRSRLTRTASSRNFRGWSRVSDGTPCSFCSMLVSRGPVYGSSSGDFAAHDRCGCSVQLVTLDDPSGGWSTQARALRDAWDEAGGDPLEYRRAIDAERRGATDDTPLIFA